MNYRKILVALLTSVSILNISVCSVEASGLPWVNDIVNSNISKKDIESSLSTVKSIEQQTNELYEKVAKSLNIDVKYVKELHALAGGKAVYFDKKANIYTDTTSPVVQEPMYIKRANTVYQKAPFSECKAAKIDRPSAYYLPDAIYSVTYDIKALMTQRYYYNRGANQEYFDSLTDATKNNIVFYEAVLIYTGESVENVNNLFLAYIDLLETKDTNEYIIENVDGKDKIKESYLNILNSYGLSDEVTTEYLATMLSYDGNMASYNNVGYVTKNNILPYIKNYTSRENMMVAAISLTGKVRYTWGGGHDGTSVIDGINPAWYNWSSLYPSEPTSEITKTDSDGNTKTVTVDNEGFGSCIRSSTYWCPIHGYGSTEFHGKTVFSAKDYLNLMNDKIDFSKYSYDDYMQVLSQINFNDGVNEHFIDGLDCSGYTSWIYNQITNKYKYDNSAMYFTSQSGIEEIPFGSDMLPGDVFAWNSHIIAIVGKVKDGSKAYVTIEQTPNVLRFGVAYYEGAKSSDIKSATEIANQANELIGGIDRNYEPAKVHNLNNVGHYTEMETVVNKVVDPVTGQETDVEVQQPVEKYYTSIGRFKGKFLDEDSIISGYDKKFKDMTAKEIISYTLTKLPMSYVNGYSIYNGDLFNIKDVSSNLGVTVVDKDEDNK